MANRSYLYVVDEVPGEGTTVRPRALAEWKWAVPDAYRVLLSPAPRAVPSTIWDPPVQAVLGDYDAGVAALERYLDALPQTEEVREWSRAALVALHDPQRRGRHLLLEVGEILEIAALPGADGEVGDAELAQAFERELAEVARTEWWIETAPGTTSKDLAQATGAGAWPSVLYFQPGPVDAAPAPAAAPPAPPAPPAPTPAPQPAPMPPTPQPSGAHPQPYPALPQTYGALPQTYGAPPQPGYAVPPPAPTGTPWLIGLLALVPIPFLSALVSGIVMASVGRGQRRRGGPNAENGRNAANWGLTYALLTVLLVVGHFVLLFTLARDSGVQGFFPLGTVITLWFALSLVHVVVSIVGGLRAGAGRVFRVPAIPFFRD
ncbi:DUF7822 domain-containing protein [Serinibacter arcticus]|nr:DUF4870 domain-containing protein [Serinibacter arcticus]